MGTNPLNNLYVCINREPISLGDGLKKNGELIIYPLDSNFLFISPPELPNNKYKLVTLNLTENPPNLDDFVIPVSGRGYNTGTHNYKGKVWNDFGYDLDHLFRKYPDKKLAVLELGPGVSATIPIIAYNRMLEKQQGSADQYSKPIIIEPLQYNKLEGWILYLQKIIPNLTLLVSEDKTESLEEILWRISILKNPSYVRRYKFHFENLPDNVRSSLEGKMDVVIDCHGPHDYGSSKLESFKKLPKPGSGYLFIL
ncbi:hypothetical protein KY358_06580 [Candidatus Woesearchaeota archaeon]|nr:hypothetical protein [Candidatus Woesearchaeota archaeon]